MLKLVVKQAGKPDKEFVVEGEKAIIGRTPQCDVVIDEPFVSKRHLQILHGTVVVDLGSSNGTFVGGHRVTQPVLLQGDGEVEISQNGLHLLVEAGELEGRAVGGAELENLRSQCTLLEAEAAELRRELEKALEDSGQDERVARLRGENESLRERVASMKDELEGRELDDGGSVQAKLAMQRVEQVQVLNEELQREVERLRSRLEAAETVEAGEARPHGATAAAPEVEALRAEAARLRDLLDRERAAVKRHEDQTALVRKLRQELEALRASAGDVAAGPSLERELEESHREVRELRARASELEGRLAEAPRPSEKVSDLFFKLQSENAVLRKKVSALEAGSSPSDRGQPARDVRLVKDLMEARLRITALEAELSNLKVVQAGSTPVPAKPVRSAPAQGSFDAHRVLQIVVDEDVEGLVRPSGGPVEGFVLVESVRLLRQFERVVTRVAGDLIQLFQLRTMLPDTAGTYRGLVGDLLAEPEDVRVRDRLVEYLETLGRWLVAAIGAHRKAGVLFAAKIKEDLSESGLTATDPLPPYARVPMLAGNELWRRTQCYLSSLSPDAIDEAIDGLARAQAQLLLNQAP
jgi:hypothetical protein